MIEVEHLDDQIRVNRAIKEKNQPLNLAGFYLVPPVA